MGKVRDVHAPAPRPVDDPIDTSSADHADDPAVRGVAILANPYSGTGPNQRHVERLAAALSDAGLTPRMVWRPDERTTLLSDPDLARWCRCVVAAGGDGSIADVINDLHAHHPTDAVPLATLPIGNENLFARQFGFTRRPGPLAAAIARGRSLRTDVGVVGGRLFTLMASGGFDATVVHRMAQWRRSATPNRHDTPANGCSLRRVNRLSYAGHIVGTICNYDYPAITVEADGQTARGAHVFIFNLPQYGGNLGIARHARGDDAMLDWVVFERPGVVSLAHYAWSVLRTRHLGRPDVPHGRARAIRLTAPTPVALQADGDPAGYTPLTVTVKPRALRVVAMH